MAVSALAATEDVRARRRELEGSSGREAGMGRLQIQSPVQGVHWFVVGMAGTMDSSEGGGGPVRSKTKSSLQGTGG